MQETDSSKQHVLEKFKKRGFHHLTLEELAITQVTPNWAEDFKAATSEDWSQYQEKALDRLSRAKFNMKWLTRESSSSYSNLFGIVARGDLKMIEEYIRINDLKACINATDDSKKTCLHIACREGHAEVVEYLVTKGWAIEARDKLLSTPLQLACNSGHANIVSYLLLKGADPRAKDSLGRNSLLFAVCSPTTEVVEVLLKSEVALLDAKDYTGRSALHYSVFNPHQRQVDISRTLLEAGISVDVPDNEMKTPLHHACESNKPRGIRLLLKWGANLKALDKTGKTPMDLAVNQSIKQLLTLYSKGKNDNPQASTSRLSSEKLPKISQKNTEKIASPQVPPPNQNSPFREKLINLLRKVQEAGVVSNQHIKKPSLYSGSWVEGILNTAALNNELASMSASEAVIKVFNVLFPYPKNLPAPQEDDIAGLDFFGTNSYKIPNQSPIYVQDDAKLIRIQQQLDTTEQSLRELQQILLSKESMINELQNVIKTKTNEVNALQNNLQDFREKHQSLLKQVPSPEEIKAKSSEKEKLIQQMEAYKIRLEDSEKKCREAKTLAETLKTELDQRPSKSDVEKLKENILKIEADNKNLRFKAGQVFISALDDTEEVEPSGQETHLHDDEVLKRLETALLGNSPSFKQRLLDADSNKDGRVTKGELAKVLGVLCLPPQDIIVMLRIAGFRRGVASVTVDSIANIVSSRGQRRENLENLLFSKLAEVFEKSDMTVDQAFEYLDVNKDGTVNFQELSAACETLHLGLNREDRYALFAVLDEDHSGTISLTELRDRLGSAAPIPKQPKSAEKNKPSNRYQEAKDLTPVSSERALTPPNFEKSQAKPVNLSKIEPVKETAKPKVTGPTKFSGNLVVALIRGKDLGPSPVSVLFRVDGAEKTLKSPILPGPAPEWNYKNRIRLYDTSTSLISSEVFAEVNGPKGLIGIAKIPWLQSLNFPNAWAVKSEYAVLEPNGRKAGFLTIHLMWMPKENIRVEGAGTLSVQVVSFAGFPKSLLQMTIGTCTAFTNLTKDAKANIKDLAFKPQEPVPSLKCSILNASNREVILWRNLSIEVALASKDWTQPLQVPLDGAYQLTLKFLWKAQSREEEKLLKAVIKIQSRFRVILAKKKVEVLKKVTRKLVARRGFAQNKKYFLVDIIEENNEYLIELHNVEPDRPMYEVISSLKCEKIEVDEIFKNIHINAYNEIVLNSAPALETRGSLGMEIVACTCPAKSYVRAEFGPAFVHSAAGPPWSKKIMLPEIVFTQIKPLKLTLFGLEKREEICKGLIDFSSSLTTPEKWTNEVSAEMGKFSISLKFIWSQIKPVQKIPIEKVEEGIKKKSTRNLIGRRGITRNKRYFLLSIYDKAGIKEIELHVADDPSFPMYEVVDKADLSPLIDLDTAISKLEISKDRKLILPKPSI